jgi:tRNA-2-methylthio-N6-dimethylallyladenosine synthase
MDIDRASIFNIQHSKEFHAYIPVITGCDNFCSYCVVPYARGREISRPPEEILNEIKYFLSNKYKEIFLLGQNVNSYRGIDHKGRIWSFARLLHSLNALPGNFWIRFVSSHPQYVNDQFTRAFSQCRKISPNLHLPLQSGSNRILQKMNRRYTRQDYLNIVNEIRQVRPETVFSTDIMVGFPGETERDFQDSLDMVKKIGFEMLYALKYSPRPETAAFRFKDNVTSIIKKQRQQILDRTWKNISLHKNQRFVGEKIAILINKLKFKGKERWVMGKNFENKDVGCVASGSLPKNPVGMWGIVLVTKAGSLGLQGKLLRFKK